MQMKGTTRFLLAAAMLLTATAPGLAQVAPYGSPLFGASPPATRRTTLATRAASGPAVTPHVEDTNCVGKQGLPNAKFELMHNVDHEHPRDVKIRTQSLDKCILE